MAPSYTSLLPLAKSHDSILTYFTTLLRTLRLSIIRQISPSCLKSEQPKVAIFHDRRIAALHVFLHIIPLGAAISLIFLNIVTYHVGYVSSLSLTALQFAAKSLEMLMQASLTTILLAFIRNRIVTNRDGIAFGGLLAPYRMTEVSYLWSLEFWGAVTCFASWTAFKTAFCALVPMFVVLGALVGPSSAILMIPRIGDYPRASLVAYMGPKDVIYADHLDLINATNADGTNGTMTLSAEEDFNHTIQALFNSESRQDIVQATDLYGAWGSRVLHAPLWEFEEETAPLGSGLNANATIPTQLLARVLQAYAEENPNDAFTPVSNQPYVNLDCWQPDSQSRGEFVDFGKNKPELNGTMLSSTFSDPLNRYRDVSPLWMGDALDNGNITTVYASHPDHSALLATIQWSEQSAATASPMACTVDAYWVVTSSQWNITTMENQDADTFLDHRKPIQRIRLSPALVMRINSITRAMDEAMANGTANSYEYPLGQYLASAIALAISVSPTLPPSMRENTNDTSLPGSSFWSLQFPDEQNDLYWRQQDRKTYSRAFTYFDTDTLNDTKLLATVEAQQFYTDYCYNSNEITVRLSLAVIFAYAVVVLSYLSYSLSTGYSGTSWASIADLVALALNSRRSEDLMNTSVGIETLDVFRKSVKIRVGDDSSCELVFPGHRDETGKGLRDIEANEPY